MESPKDADGPWKRSAAGDETKAAESKEARNKRRESNREIRAAVRKERRHEKGEAKRARKANVKRAAKWTGERKALDKLKKAAKKPVLQEKKRKRMLQRTESLEPQAERLLVEAELARARQAHLKRLQEEEDEERAKLLEEMKNSAAKETDDFIPLDAEDNLLALVHAAAPQTNGHPGSDETGSDESSQDDKGDNKIETEESSKPEVTAEEDETAQKSSKKKGKKVKKSEGPTEMEQELSIDPAQDGGEKTKEEKKKKKKKRKHSETEPEEKAQAAPSGDEMDVDEVDEKKAKKDKKAEKKRKRDSEAADVQVDVAEEASAKKKHKKDKKEKKAKKENATTEDQAPAPTEEQPADDAAAQWNVQGLDGGAGRQAKFLRLLGGKKNNVALGGAASASKEKLDMKHVSDDLERQFNAGLQMKFGTHGQRQGLGA